MELLTQKEFLDSCKSDQKLFDNLLLQFFDIPKFSMNDVTIKNSKLLFCNFYDSRLKNVTWENCTFYYASFYGGTASGMLFDKCDIEQLLMDNFQFDKTRFSRCNIRWSGILNSNIRSVDMSSSSQYKFFTDLSQLTQQDIEEAVGIIMHDIERMDVSTRLKIKQMIRQDFERYNMSIPNEEKKAYASHSEGEADRPLTYGEVKALVESTFGSYGKSKEYGMKKPYDTDKKYK